MSLLRQSKATKRDKIRGKSEARTCKALFGKFGAKRWLGLIINQPSLIPRARYHGGGLALAEPRCSLSVTHVRAIPRRAASKSKRVYTAEHVCDRVNYARCPRVHRHPVNLHHPGALPAPVSLQTCSPIARVFARGI